MKPDNPFFAKVEVNRIWGHLMGRGIVEPVDDFRDSNPPSSAPLLAALADDFAEHGYDRKHVMRTILNSRTYQLSSRKNEFNATDIKYFSHATHAAALGRAIARRDLPRDQRCREVRRPAGRHPGHAAAQPRRRQRLPEGLRPAGPRNGLPVRAFDRLEPVAGVADDQRPAGALARCATRRTACASWSPPARPNEEIITELYLAGLCRAAERAGDGRRHQAHRQAGDRMRGLEDVCWAMLNANEFLFQH